jgi:alkaline phosphatase D
VLGRAQWGWLEERLAEPADIHLVVSSIQVIPEDHCFEKWANFPHERERLLQLLAVASAPALILSGDRHFAEISRIELPGARGALLELTSSGMNSAGAGKNDPNRHRALAPVVREDNFATLDLDWDSAGLRLGLAIRGTDGALLQQLQARYGRAD